MDPVVHFEMPAKNKKRMIEFYTKVFDWKTQQLGKDMSEYVVVTTTNSNKDGRPKMPGAINGGFYQETKEEVSNHPTVVIAVKDINEYIKKVNESGGKVIHGPHKIPDIGVYASFIDTEGNRVSILEPDTMK